MKTLRGRLVERPAQPSGPRADGSIAAGCDHMRRTCAHGLSRLRDSGIFNSGLEEVNVSHAKSARIHGHRIAESLGILVLGRIKNYPRADILSDARGK